MSAILKGIRAAFGDVEMTPYTVMVERDGYEERLYPARKWACTTMKGTSQQELVSPMFRALFNYISGKNDPNIRIDMTSPVTTYVEPGAGPTCESTFTMAFLVPEEHQLTPPLSVDKTIFIEDRPELTVLTRRFGGYTSDEIIIKEAKELAEAIKKNGETGVNFDQYYVVGYDPPFKLFSRRNEIWFVKTKESVKNQEMNEMIEKVIEIDLKEECKSVVKESEEEDKVKEEEKVQQDGE
ncbi:heme-binding protein 2-like [Homarus americanus]|uniref:Heme-binding protein 2-like 4 n=1 Tax=Homarus americanus TaxID=6706 RepID=A0A8J5JU60_HOMAM|nr:heme-binding protein 2-like [Homarus americanus]KAG7164232.1 Heme-binding protein 2-like 4 [Homarus americanus]